eukprot:TRINITY_DN111579_c0_g1_i1.p1 TRINITY_DN111579_c0_g1~~TRINITY_DN111579_c0_g1_i1.p1  ORF type:complete len:432 (-),score=127.27 TRINITY_DN111579_c0_g1_i1:70-1365(-)
MSGRWWSSTRRSRQKASCSAFAVVPRTLLAVAIASRCGAALQFEAAPESGTAGDEPGVLEHELAGSPSDSDTLHLDEGTNLTSVAELMASLAGEGLDNIEAERHRWKKRRRSSTTPGADSLLQLDAVDLENPVDTTAEMICPWFFGVHTNKPNLMRCYQGQCNPNSDPAGWGCCAAKGGPFQCPSTRPFICDKKDAACGGENCCKKKCSEDGGIKPCQGPPGDAGEAGPVGENGTEGDFGPVGQTGPAGETGENAATLMGIDLKTTKMKLVFPAGAIGYWQLFGVVLTNVLMIGTTAFYAKSLAKKNLEEERKVALQARDQIMAKMKKEAESKNLTPEMTAKLVKQIQDLLALEEAEPGLEPAAGTAAGPAAAGPAAAQGAKAPSTPDAAGGSAGAAPAAADAQVAAASGAAPTAAGGAAAAAPKPATPGQ